MTKIKAVYWTTTGAVGGIMLYTACTYFADPDMSSSFERLGFPDYFRVELGIAKGVGALILLLPIIGTEIKNIAYVGFAITFVSAIIAHTVHRDPVLNSLQALFLLICLAISYFMEKEIRNDPRHK